MIRLACIVAATAVLATPAVAAPTTRTFDGMGASTLAPFRLSKAATLRWQTSGGLLGGLFALKMLNPRADGTNPQLVFSKARSGIVHLAPGVYKLKIDAFPGTRWHVTVG